MGIDTSNKQAVFGTGRASVVVTGLVLDDPDVVKAARGYAPEDAGDVDLAPFVREQMKLAAVVTAAADGNRDLLDIQRQLGHVAERTEKAVADAAARTQVATDQAQKELDRARAETTKAVTDAAATAAQQLADLPNRVTKDISSIFTGDDNAVVEATRGAMVRALGDVQTSFEQRMKVVVADVESKWDLHDPASPVAQMTTALRSEQERALGVHQDGTRQIVGKLDDIATRLVQMATQHTTRAETASVTPIKGATYEDAVHAILDAVAARHGDAYLRTGNAGGVVNRSKKGDGVLSVMVPDSTGRVPRVVVEMHNGDTSTRNWPAYLDEALRNREADVALGIVRTQAQLPGAQPLRVWGTHRIVVAFDPEVDDPGLLQAAVLLLRAQACLTAARTGTDEGRLRSVEADLVAATNDLEQFAELERLTASIKANSDKTVTKVAGLREALTRHIAAALHALRDGDTPISAQEPAA